MEAVYAPRSSICVANIHSSEDSVVPIVVKTSKEAIPINGVGIVYIYRFRQPDVYRTVYKAHLSNGILSFPLMMSAPETIGELLR